MANEINGVMKWFYERLSGSSLLTTLVGRHPARNVWNIYEGAALQNASYPNIVVQFVSGPYRNGASGKKVFGKFTIQVRVFSEGEEFSTIADAADEIEALCQQEEQLAAPTVLGCMVSRPLHGVEAVDGVRRNYLGTEFTVFARTKI